jgi:glutamyl-tRNA synthetase
VVRTRFAPSPTGALHVGNARIAVLNWLFTRHEQGEFILRIEDTDRERNVPGAERGICDDLAWLGLRWDEGPSADGYPARGMDGPYRQSERLESYRDYAARLRAGGYLYPCFCTDAELEEARRSAHERGAQPHYSGRCRALSLAGANARIEAGEPFALRFRVPPSRTVIVRELARGEVRVGTAEISDFIVLRSDGLPTYNFAVVVDDITMRITHVIRGSGHLSNTPRQVLLYDALGAPAPVFAHIGTVLGPDRQKLSKRHGAASIAEYRAQGYHPEAVLNYLALLSWASRTGEDVLGREQLVDELRLEDVGVADVVFDGAKLRWLSSKHIERMTHDELVAAVAPHVDRERFPLSAELLAVAITAVRTHLATFGDIDEQLAAFFPPDDSAPAALDATGRAVVEAAYGELGATDWSEAELGAALMRVTAGTRARGRALYEPLRLALTGTPHGPPFVALLQVQGRDAVLARLRAALAAPGTER